MAARSYPTGQRGQIIGTPYKGTHATAFNVKGGSNNWESENAYDIAVPVGTPVYAVAAGTIGSQIGPQGGGRFAGDRLHLVTSSNEFFYAHLSRLVVRAGDQVSAGQLLGYSGEADGVAHLHFASKTGDPAAYLGDRPQGGAADTTTTATASTDTQPVQAVQPVAPIASGDTDLGVTPSPLTTEPVQPPPGSGIYSTNSFLTDAWNRIASQPGSSPDAQLLASNAQLATGG